MFAKPNASVRLHEPSSDPKPFRPNLLISEAPTMSKEELTSLIHRVATNTSLRDQLASASDLQTDPSQVSLVGVALLMVAQV